MGIGELMQNDTMFLKQGNEVFHLKQPTQVTKIIAKQNTIQNYWLFSRQFKKKKCLLDSLVKKKKKKEIKQFTETNIGNLFAHFH